MRQTVEQGQGGIKRPVGTSDQTESWAEYRIIVHRFHRFRLEFTGKQNRFALNVDSRNVLIRLVIIYCTVKESFHWCAIMCALYASLSLLSHC